MPLYALGDKAPQIESDDVFIAPSADLIGDVVVKKGANIWFNTTLRADDNTITIGVDSNIQDGVVMHVDPRFPCTVGDNVTVGHLATIHACTICDNTLIGMGATILDGATVGSHTLIGAHALVGAGKEIPEGVLVLGAPGKIVRDLTEEELAMVQNQGQFYAKKGQRFRDEFRLVG